MEVEMSTSEDRRARFTEELTQRAAGDPAFRQLLLSDPRAAIEEAFGIQVPDQVAVQVLEESADRVYIVLPAQGEAAPDQEFQRIKLTWLTWWGCSPVSTGP
jgi:hypothetical protein